VLATSVIAPAAAAEITAFFPLSMEHTAHEVVPPFEKSSGHKVTIQYGTAGAVAPKVRNGEIADVLISAAAQIDGFSKENKLVADSGFGLAKVGVGMLARKGAAKPDISSVDAFKRALLNAKSIALADPAAGGAVGIYAPALMERLGISAELRPKIKLVGGGVAPVEPVIKGDAEIGLTTISEIIQFQPAIELVGPLPPEIQTFFAFTAGIPGNAREPAAAKALLDFFTTPRAISILKAKGLESG